MNILSKIGKTKLAVIALCLVAVALFFAVPPPMSERVDIEALHQITTLPAHQAATIAPTSFTPAPAAPEGFTLAVEVGHLSLYHRESDFSMALRDNAAGALWLSYFPMEKYTGEPLNDILLAEVASLFRMDFVDLGGAADRVISANLLELHPAVTTTRLENGFRYDFLFTDLNLRLAIDFALEENRLHVSVPPAGIIEGYGADAQMVRHLPALQDFIGYMQEIYNEISADSGLPAAYTRNLRQLQTEISQFESTLAQIDSPDTTHVMADRLLAALRRMREITSSGEPTALGILNRIRTSESLPAEVTQRYNRMFFDANDRYDMAEMAISILRNVRVTGVVEISLLPFFGSAGDTADGYMVYPDGSGARTFFRESGARFAGAYRMDVFGDDAADASAVSGANLVGRQQVMLPVVGVVKDGAGFAAVIDSGSEAGIVNFRPSGYVYNINRVYFGFRYRQQVAAPAQMGVFTAGQARRLEAQRQDVYASVTYIFLPPQNTSYSGMANAVRAFFLERGILRPSPLAARPTVAIEMAGGFNNRQLIFDNYITLTSYNQAAAIIRDLVEHQPSQLLVNYTAWHDGRNTNNAAPISAFGGQGDFRDLLEGAAALNARLFLELDTHRIVRGRDRFFDGDLAISTDNLVIGGDGVETLLSPAVTYARTMRQMGQLADFGARGVTLSGAGNLLYSDYHPTRPVSRLHAISYWQLALQNTRSNLMQVLPSPIYRSFYAPVFNPGFAATRGGNAYVLGMTDWLKDIPQSATGFVFTDESIPLFQMIVHGSIPFTGKPVNLFHDLPMELLRMIELGYTPFFAVTYNEPDFRVGFASRYTNIRDMIVGLSHEFAASFAPLAGRHMIRHERTTGEGGQILATVTYAGGYQVLLNYGTQAAAINGHTVQALGYAVIDSHGSIFAAGTFYNERGAIYEAQELPEFEAARESYRLSVFSAVVLGVFGVLLLSAGIFFAARLWKNARPKDV